MINFNRIESINSSLWVISNFFSNFDEVRSSYRSAGQPWQTQYSDRLLTPWGSNALFESVLEKSVLPLSKLTQHDIDKQVCYASLDLGGSQIMMHRLHSDIRCFVQVCMGDDANTMLNSCFCIDNEFNATHPVDYVNIDELPQSKIIEIEYRPNTAWILSNSPRTFFGTRNKVPNTQIRETLNLHFGSVLKTAT